MCGWVDRLALRGPDATGGRRGDPRDARSGSRTGGRGRARFLLFRPGCALDPGARGGGRGGEVGLTVACVWGGVVTIYRLVPAAAPSLSAAGLPALAVGCGIWLAAPAHGLLSPLPRGGGGGCR